MIKHRFKYQDLPCSYFSSSSLLFHGLFRSLNMIIIIAFDIFIIINTIVIIIIIIVIISSSSSWRTWVWLRLLKALELSWQPILCGGAGWWCCWFCYAADAADAADSADAAAADDDDDDGLPTYIHSHIPTRWEYVIMVKMGNMTQSHHV